jgi:hypothetical protein
MGKAPVVEGGTGNTVFNNKWDESSDFEDLKAEVIAHKAESVTQAGGVHGFIEESGNWSPATNLGAFVSKSANYVRSGTQIHCEARVEFPTSTHGGAVNISSLPFASRLNPGQTIRGFAIVGENYTASEIYYIRQNTLYPQIITFMTTGGAQVTGADVSGKTLDLIFDYII